MDGTWPGIIHSLSKTEDFLKFFFILLQFLGFLMLLQARKGRKTVLWGFRHLRDIAKPLDGAGRGSLNVSMGHPKKFWDVIPNLSFCMNSQEPEPTGGHRGMQ